MGTFIGIAGDVSVPEERQRGYVAQIMTVLTHGGMLQSETIRLFGRFVTLIHFPEFDVDSGCLEFNYNYLENEYWERCALNRGGILSSGKVGSHQFRDVALAAYVLEEHESCTDALATLDGRLFCTNRHVGWLNHVLGTNYSTRSLCDLAKVVHAFSKEELADRCTEFINVCNGRTEAHPAEPVSTADFLRCSPDDLAFLWSPNGKIEFSAAMWKWLSSLKHRLDSLTAAGTELIPASDFLKTMVMILAEINPSDSLIGNFAWREMFFTWIQTASNLRVQASVVLMKELASQPSDAPQCVSNLRRYGRFVSSIRRCIAVHDWMCLRLRFLLLSRRFLGARTLKPAAAILLGDYRCDCVIGFRRGICSDLAAYSIQANRRITWWHHGEFNAERVTYGDMCKKMDAVAVVSQACKDMLQDQLPEFADKLVCIPNMLDVNAIKQKVTCSLYTDNMLHIISVGHLMPEKHFENIIPTAVALRDASIDFIWHIVGEGPERAKLEALIAEHDLKNHVILEGSKANPYPYIKYANLFVHPSYVESQGLTVLEAMALGVPCVVTKSRGPCEFIEDGVNGLLTEQSPESLTEKVLTILNDKELYRHIKENTRCPEQFSPEHVMEQIEALIDN